MKKIKNFINYIILYFTPHPCFKCGNKSGNLSIGQAMMWNGMGGRCIDCVSKDNNCNSPTLT